jgi:hypothetical protein
VAVAIAGVIGGLACFCMRGGPLPPSREKGALVMTEAWAAGPYGLAHKLGAGAVGEVWLTRHMDLNEHVALKVLATPDWVGQLLHGSTITLNVQHPDIVGLHHIGACNNQEAVG